MSELRRRRKGKNQEEKMTEYTNSEITEAINERIHSERDRHLLRRRYVDGITYERLAEEFELSVAQVKRIIYKHEPALFKEGRKRP